MPRIAYFLELSVRMFFNDRAANAERGIWQRRYWEHTLRDDRDFARHMDYSHFNRVKHGFVARPGLTRVLRSTGWCGSVSARPIGAETPTIRAEISESDDDAQHLS